MKKSALRRSEYPIQAYAVIFHDNTVDNTTSKRWPDELYYSVFSVYQRPIERVVGIVYRVIGEVLQRVHA